MKNNINIPKEKLNQAVSRGIEKGRQEKPMKIRNSSMIIKRVASVVVIGGISLGLTFPVVVQAFPNIESAIIDFVESVLPKSYSNKLKHESKKNNIVISDGKAIVTLENSTLDNYQFIANMIIESDFFKQYEESDLEHNLYANLEVSIGDNKNIVGWGAHIRKIDDNKASLVVTADVGDIKLEDNVDVYIKLQGLEIQSNEWKSNDIKELKGNWDFSFKTDKVESIKRINIKDEIELDGKTMTLESIEVTPLASYIKLTADENISDKWVFASYKIVDNNGKAYRNAQIDGHTDEKAWNFTIAIYDDLSNIESLKITPYTDEQSIPSKIHGQDIIKMTTTMDEGSEVEDIIVSRPVEKRDLNVDAKPAHKYEGEKISYNLNIDKEKKFYTIDELIGKSINTGDGTSVTIKDITVNDKNTTIMLKVNGDYNVLSQVVLFDEDMRDIYSGIYVTHKGKWPSNSHWNNAKDTHYASGLATFIIDKIDVNKKYKLAVPIQKEINLNSGHTMNINLK
ncbi:DUF5643 domain-containing protein [Romboutsia sp. 1001713B170131_170501_G6]|uniref:DUF5643 domain-containing protein n=1 Tax=Romboutsia sp. 1001713B170131_170501_G6 TaxID=2787108 RepID=UPI0018AB8CD9|nr:DUF5643 domain-containing protein [Romboutsia sp. 1001713B170131_170501_G6]